MELEALKNACGSHAEKPGGLGILASGSIF